MYKWEKHKKHDEDVRALCDRLGFTDSKGQIRRFNGKQFWPELRKTGHDSMGFQRCRCNNYGYRHLRVAK